MQTLDGVVAAASLGPADVMKIDVQGYELEVLKGASETLKSVEAVLMEVSLMPLYENNPLITEVLNFMSERNFIAYDICTIMRHPEHQTLAQVDVIFIRKNSPLSPESQ